VFGIDDGQKRDRKASLFVCFGDILAVILDNFRRHVGAAICHKDPTARNGGKFEDFPHFVDQGRHGVGSAHDASPIDLRRVVVVISMEAMSSVSSCGPLDSVQT